MDRRTFLKSSTAAFIAFGGLGTYLAYSSPDQYKNQIDGFGPLMDDAKGVLALPKGFSYKIISKAGEQMDDGLFVPQRHDGMAAFQNADGTTTLIRNHENYFDVDDSFHRGDEKLFQSINPNLIYDNGEPGYRPAGGTTSIIYDTKSQQIVGHYASLVGTAVNCCGGPTPRNTWLSCEEVLFMNEDGMEQNHGYVFEVPSDKRLIGQHKPQPIKAMGRFKHEATATDPRTGFVYETEDEHESLFYRYRPVNKDNLLAGGALEALVIEGQNGFDTRNWNASPTDVSVGQKLKTRWVAMEDVDNPDEDLRFRGREEKGAAIFARGEGMWFGHDSVFFACTSGGSEELGQIWRYTPNLSDPQNPDQTGTLELFSEPNQSDVLERSDNITIAPWGDVLVCEDGPGTNYLRGITPEGKVYTLARNDFNDSEIAGVCFSPDGSTLFFNLQTANMTIAITGPWQALRS